MFNFVGGSEGYCICNAEWSQLQPTSLKLLQEDEIIKLSIRMEQDTEPKVIPAKWIKVLNDHVFLRMKLEKQ